ncbi:MAG: 50S ribosomal protein L6 [Planctomycetota bacterium]|nr:50S ribosomal protein L6 [Planctomycetota bacterium]MDA1105261.1 50S ribosomal protein L6 [Planctomycetota bacterium]
MSLIGKKPIAVPSAVKVTLNAAARQVSVQGPKGSLSFVHRPEVIVAWDEGTRAITCSPKDAAALGVGSNRAYWGTTRAIIRNMVEGVEKGYEKKLEIVGVGYNAKVQGKKVVLALGFANLIELPIPEGVTVAVDQNTNVTISGSDRQKVGAMASLIRSKRKPEPYNGKGIKYVGEQITRKQGKAFGS